MLKTPRGNRLHIAIFGRRNVGKSSLINAITGQNISLVSEYAGTTTDPVYKAMELLPLGPVVFIDTAGLDDTGDLGKLRVKKTRQVVDKADLALMVFTANQEDFNLEEELLLELKGKNIPTIGVINKIDLLKNKADNFKFENIPLVKVSAEKNINIGKLKELIQIHAPMDYELETLIGDVIKSKSTVMLVTTQDIQAPKNRLILPQVQTIRDILDNDSFAYVVKVDQLKNALETLSKKPDLVITDSQVFEKVKSIVSKDIKLTSFSIIMARFKGELQTYVEGARTIGKIRPQDKILIAEACTHHVLKGDISREQLPKLLEEKAGGKLNIDVVAGGDFPEDLSKYQLILHCGACMINRKQVLSRIIRAREQDVPITNFGLAFAYFSDILDRAIEIFNI